MRSPLLLRARVRLAANLPPLRTLNEPMSQSEHLTDAVSLRTLIDERITPVAEALCSASREGDSDAVRSLMRELAIAVNAAAVLLDPADPESTPPAPES